MKGFGMLLLISACWLAAFQPALGEFSVASNDGTVSILDSGRNVATYGFDDLEVRRAYFANVMAPNGHQVTRSFPPRNGVDPIDHRNMHPGIWMAFGDLNGGDFWRGKAKVRHQRFVDAPEVQGDTVHFAVENDYILEGQAICRDVSHYDLLRRHNGYLLLIDSTLEALTKLDFGDQQEMGLGIRMASILRVEQGSGQIVDSQGHINEAECWGHRAKWIDYGGLIDGRRTGVLLMPSPQNFRPSRFHTRDYGLIVANPFSDLDFGQGDENRPGPGGSATTPWWRG